MRMPSITELFKPRADKGSVTEPKPSSTESTHNCRVDDKLYIDPKHIPEELCLTVPGTHPGEVKKQGVWYAPHNGDEHRCSDCNKWATLTTIGGGQRFYSCSSTKCMRSVVVQMLQHIKDRSADEQEQRQAAMAAAHAGGQ